MNAWMLNSHQTWTSARICCWIGREGCRADSRTDCSHYRSWKKSLLYCIAGTLFLQNTNSKVTISSFCTTCFKGIREGGKRLRFQGNFAFVIRRVIFLKFFFYFEEEKYNFRKCHTRYWARLSASHPLADPMACRTFCSPENGNFIFFQNQQK